MIARFSSRLDEPGSGGLSANDDVRRTDLDDVSSSSECSLESLWTSFEGSGFGGMIQSPCSAGVLVWFVIDAAADKIFRGGGADSSSTFRFFPRRQQDEQQ